MTTPLIPTRTCAPPPRKDRTEDMELVFAAMQPGVPYTTLELKMSTGLKEHATRQALYGLHATHRVRQLSCNCSCGVESLHLVWVVDNDVEGYLD